MFGVFRLKVVSGSSSASVLLRTRITDNVRRICHVTQPGAGVNLRLLREVMITLHPCFSMQLQNRMFSSDSVGRSKKLYSSSALGDGDGDDDFLPEKPDLQVQGVDPRKGWGFRGVHKAIICGKVGQAPLQKILRNGRTVTIFTVGTGGMFDQRTLGAKDLPKPAQWHRIAVHNETLGAYAVQQLTKNSSVYVEGDIETRVYNDSINGEVKNIPEICIRRDGKIRLFKTGENISSISFDELREGLI